MARRAFAVSQLVEILMRWQRGESLRAIAGSLAISRNTVREYVRTAETAGLPREPALSHEALTAFVSEHFPAAAGRGASVLWRRELDVRREEIAEGLKTNRVGMVWAQMHSAGRIKASLSTFRRGGVLSGVEIGWRGGPWAMVGPSSTRVKRLGTGRQDH